MAEQETPPRARKTAPPRAARAADDKTVPEDKPKPRTPEERKLVAAVSDVYKAIGVATIGVGIGRQDYGVSLTGKKMVEMSDGTADAWIDVARRSPAVKAYLVKVTQVSAAGVLIGMHFAMVAPLLASRGAIPVTMAGLSDEDLAEAGFTVVSE